MPRRSSLSRAAGSRPISAAFSFSLVALVGVPRSYWQVSLIVAPALSTTPAQHEAVIGTVNRASMWELRRRRVQVVCAKFSKSVMGGGLAELISKLASLCLIGQTHPFVPTCPPIERRAQPWSRLAAGHRRRRRAAVWTAASTVLG